ncbi:homeodomain-like superfamily protein [Striga asiatica]|uniref:Homeodomain-like superfamily protein n=1 Tax=Striga asiatica TaxID=4170 RepID=A0A5A7NX42_STRAF|nr:homeodomain-like superfamily protein [Striga asiatica]
MIIECENAVEIEHSPEIVFRSEKIRAGYNNITIYGKRTPVERQTNLPYEKSDSDFRETSELALITIDWVGSSVSAGFVKLSQRGVFVSFPHTTKFPASVMEA